jgi:signal transduction histidine kinase
MTPPGARRTYRERVTGRPPHLSRLLDLVLALGVTTVGVAEIWVPFQSRAGEGDPVASTVVTLVLGAALTQRRAHPLGTAVVVLGAWPLAFLLVPVHVLFFGQFVPMAVAVFSAARHGPGRVPFVGAGLAAATLLFFDLFVAELQAPGEIVFHWGVFAIVWGFGFGLRRHEQRAEESTRRAVEAEVAAAEQAMAAVVAERTRIARELHDIVAHSVSTMVVQAGAAEQVVGEDPELVRRALAAIRTTGADALGEMRRVVAMLRDDEAEDRDTGSRAPQPGLDGLPALVSATRAAGLDATLEVRGAPQPLPPGLELAGYRVVQEALTNARRHAGAGAVRVLVEHEPTQLRVTVSDDGAGSGAPRRDGPGGHGLVGMRERVAMYGGRVEAGDGPDGGFVVRAVLPLDRDHTAVPTVTGRSAPAPVHPATPAAVPEVTA